MACHASMGGRNKSNHCGFQCFKQTWLVHEASAIVPTIDIGTYRPSIQILKFQVEFNFKFKFTAIKVNETDNKIMRENSWVER